MERLRLQQRSYVSHGSLQRRERHPVERGGAGTVVEAEHQPHRCRLAGTVRSEEAGHTAGEHLEGQVVYGGLSGIDLAQPLRLDDGHEPHPVSRWRGSAAATRSVSWSGWPTTRHGHSPTRSPPGRTRGLPTCPPSAPALPPPPPT